MKALLRELRPYRLALTLVFALPGAGIPYAASAGDAPPIEDRRLYVDDRLGLTVIAGRTELPAGSVWELRDQPEGSALRQVQVAVRNVSAQEFAGRRKRLMTIEKKQQEARWEVRRFYNKIDKYAVENGGVGPAIWEDLELEDYSAKWLEKKRSHYFLIPGARFERDEKSGDVAAADAVPLVVQIKPFIDDGRHWICYTDGRTTRVEVDPELLAQYGLKLSFQEDFDAVRPGPPPQVVDVYALVNDQAPGVAGARSASVVFRDAVTGAEERRSVPTTGAAEGGRKLLEAWAEVRSERWSNYLAQANSPLLAVWQSRLDHLYDAPGKARDETDAGRRRAAGRANQQIDTFSFMGGRPAIEETLQLELIADPKGDDGGGDEFALADIEGVRVKAHPFEQMLAEAGVEPVRVPLAEAVPEDRFFVYFTDPKALFGLTEKGAPFLASLGTLVTGNDLRYDIADRYYGALGLSEAWVRQVVEAGLVVEMGAFLPDLFAIEGTDLTVLAKVERTPVFDALLKLLGLDAGGLGGVVAVAGPAGETAYWAVRGDLLFISTARAELDRALELVAAGGVGSLGRSAEFQFMLHKVPVTDATGLYAYFSDPFIRRLVGPEVKIGQLRRARSLAAMEAASAAALLRELDRPGAGAAATVPSLVDLGYLAPRFQRDGITLGPGYVATSETWGSAPRARPLSAHPVTHVTRAEKHAYDRYQQNYTRYWRRFFDPISVRLEKGADGEYALTVFILPLLDDTLYNALREVLPADRESFPPLRPPAFDPAPVVTFSMNLQDKGWLQVAAMLEDLGERYFRLNPQIYDLLGPQLHLAVHDADPIIRLGSGEIAGVFTANQIAQGNDMFMLPLVVAIFTRPCDIALQVSDPRRVQEILDAAHATDESVLNNWLTFRLYRVGEGEASKLVVSLRLIGAFKIDFDLRVQGDYLVFSNHPWTNPVEAGAPGELELNGAAVKVDVAAMRQALGGAFASSMERERTATYRSMAHLYPWLAAGAEDPAAAARWSETAFGYRPEFPGDGAVQFVNGDLVSVDFGDIYRERQPAFDPARPFGAFQGLNGASIEIGMEEDGLRSVLRWSMAR